MRQSILLTPLCALLSTPHLPRHPPIALTTAPARTAAPSLTLKIDKLSYKELQAACKNKGLGAKGKADELRERLLAAQNAPSPLPPPPESAAPKREIAPKAPMQPASDEDDATTTAAAAATTGGFTYDSRGALIERPTEGAESAPSGADLELTILGSGACNPSPWRSASCAALRVRDSYWLFDVGEGTQVQLQKTSVRPSKIDRIFITHAHGDHCFGLPGLLCLIGRGRAPNAKPVQIYGPHGLRAYLQLVLAFTGTRMLPPYEVHEMHGIPLLRRQRDPRPPMTTRPRPTDGKWGEVGGTDSAPNADGSWWTLFHEEGMRVSAAPVHHTVPTVGFVIAEDDKPGRLLVDKVMPILEANADGIREAFGVRDPRALLKRVTKLQPGEEIVLPSGDAIKASDVLGEAREGRKIVLLGDCCDASLVEPLGKGADLLVHEATNAYLPQFGDKGGAAALERETARHGHSTPQMAGRLARRLGARSLLLTHFSQRYHPAAKGVMAAITRAASAEAGEHVPVGAAHDTLAVPVWQRDREKPLMPSEALPRE